MSCNGSTEVESGREVCCFRFGMREPVASGFFFAGVWGAALAMVPRLTRRPTCQGWDPEKLAIDGFHHLVYAVSNSLALAILFRGSKP